MQIQTLTQPGEEQGSGLLGLVAGGGAGVLSSSEGHRLPGSPTGRLLAALPGKPDPCLGRTLPVSSEFTKAMMESWLLCCCLGHEIIFVCSPEAGGPAGASPGVCFGSSGPEPLRSSGYVDSTTASSSCGGCGKASTFTVTLVPWLEGFGDKTSLEEEKKARQQFLGSFYPGVSVCVCVCVFVSSTQLKSFATSQSC